VNETELQQQLSEARAELGRAEEEVKAAIAKEKEFDDMVQQAQEAYNGVQAERTQINKNINLEEAALERLRGKLHETLQKARLEEVTLPMIGDDERAEEEEVVEGEEKTDAGEGSGSNETSTSDEENAGVSVSQASSQHTSSLRSSQAFTQDSRSRTHFSQPTNPVVLRDQERVSAVDYSKLRSIYKRRVNDKDDKKVVKEFEERIQRLTSDIATITPNMKVSKYAFACVFDWSWIKSLFLLLLPILLL
jgi:hypothetical protein